MSGFVYVMEADNGEIKVGISGTPYARLSAVRKEYASRRGFSSIRLVGFVKCSHPLAAEMLAHRSLEQLAVGGEWYRMDALPALVTVLWAALIFDEDAHVQWGRQ